MTAAPPLPAVLMEGVSIVFGDNPEQALPLMDRGLDRQEIKAACGQVLGVSNCTLRVAEGEIVVLMGLSGSGKSTLLRAINGLNPVTRGRESVCDGNDLVDVTKAGPAVLRRIRQTRVAMVFQQFGLLPWRNVRENVGLGLELSGMGRAARAERVEQQLSLVGLSDWADRRVSDLSGGMQQRVGLARAFATEAPILLMDEPFSALDPLIRSRLQDELLDLQKWLRRTIVFVSHDLDEAFKIGNRIAIMDGGRIVQVGTPREIYRAPRTPYVAEFVANMNPLGVLTAEDALVEAPPTPLPGARAVPASTPIREVMEMLRRGPPEISVTGADGKIIGALTIDTVNAALLRPGR